MDISLARIFLAAPFSQFLAPDGAVERNWKDRILTLRSIMMQAGFPVFSAHVNEQWGAGWLPAHMCVPNDFRGMKTCDLVCAYLGRPVSAGVAVELGWASAMSKPVLLILEQGQDRSQMIEGLSAVHKVRELILPHGWTDSATTEIADAAITFAKELSARASTAWRAVELDIALGYERQPSPIDQQLERIRSVRARTSNRNSFTTQT